MEPAAAAGAAAAAAAAAVEPVAAAVAAAAAGASATSCARWRAATRLRAFATGPPEIGPSAAPLPVARGAWLRVADVVVKLRPWLPHSSCAAAFCSWEGETAGQMPRGIAAPACRSSCTHCSSPERSA